MAEFQVQMLYRHQIIATIAATLILFSSGNSYGWIGPTLHLLSFPNSSIPITTAEASWLAGMIPLGGIFGPILMSAAADHIGRKIAILMNVVPFLLTWLIIYFAKSVYHLYCAQFIAGLASGAAFTVAPMYIGEIASPKIRGILGNFMSVQFNAGILWEYIIVPQISIQMNAIISASIPILCLCTFIWMPESPYYCLMKNKEKRAEKSLKFLRQTKQISTELAELKLAVYKMQDKNFLLLFKANSNRLALIIILGIITAQEFSGLTAVISYAQIIFSQSGSPISVNLSAIILAVCNLVVIIVCSLLVDSWGRRPLLILSSITTAIPLFAIGFFFHLQSLKYENIELLTLIPVISFIVYKLTFGIGLGPLPYVCLAEVFPTNVKAFASCLVSIYGAATGFIVAKLYQIVVDHFGIPCIFYFFTICCLLGAIFVYFMMPETKGRTLDEIQEELKLSRRKK